MEPACGGRAFEIGLHDGTQPDLAPTPGNRDPGEGSPELSLEGDEAVRLRHPLDPVVVEAEPQVRRGPSGRCEHGEEEYDEEEAADHRHEDEER